MSYQNGKIYRIVCETGLQYIGSTIMPLEQRFNSHYTNKVRCSCKEFINPKIELIESYPCATKAELLIRERYWIENSECVNLIRPIISEEERKILKAKCDKEYRSRPENKDKAKFYNKEYQETNKEKLKLKKAERYQKNKESILAKRYEKVTCECGEVVMKQNLSRHKKSSRHKSYA